MIYLDAGATSFEKPPQVGQAMARALKTCASVGRGGYEAADAAAREVFGCRVAAAELFHAQASQVVFTFNCTHGLNIALGSLLSPGDRVAVSGFEHNAVMRTVYALGAEPVVAGRRLFCWEDTLYDFEQALRSGVKAAVFTHTSNVFGYVLPVGEMAALCRQYSTPFVVDAAQSAGVLPIDFARWGADFVAMPGHKSLLGPQGTGLLLCRDSGVPLLYGGTGSQSISHEMPEELPERLEAGTMNVTGIAGLSAALRYLKARGTGQIAAHEARLTAVAARSLRRMGMRVFSGSHQSGVLSFVPPMDCEDAAAALAQRGVAVRAGLHCAPLAHESAGTLKTGTVRMSFGAFTWEDDLRRAMEILGEICR